MYVCCEVSATGIMGANRLASNSLIECLVFANRAIADSVKEGCVEDFPTFDICYQRDENNAQLYAELKEKISGIMNVYAGIIRSEVGLKEGLKHIDDLEHMIDETQTKSVNSAACEYYLEASRRLLCVARLIMSPALLRKESRGVHYREDYPCTDELYALHSIQQYGEQITTAPVNMDYFKFE